MANREQKSNKEKRKPKAEKPKAGKSPGSTFSSGGAQTKSGNKAG